jgi:DNA invertase Pin-like site-specific DNA recombinase
MYRKPTEKQRHRLEAMRRGRERAAQAREPRGRPPDLPELRREVTVIDFDSGKPVSHTLQLYRTSRVDVFRVVAAGLEWKRCGWSAVLAGLRKAFPRVPSPRSAFWW